MTKHFKVYNVELFFIVFIFYDFIVSCWKIFWCAVVLQNYKLIIQSMVMLKNVPLMRLSFILSPFPSDLGLKLILTAFYTIPEV